MLKKALILMGLATMAACGGEPPASDVGVATADVIQPPACTTSERMFPDTIYTTPAFDPPMTPYYTFASYSYGTVVTATSTIKLHNNCQWSQPNVRSFTVTITSSTPFGYNCTIDIGELRFPNQAHADECAPGGVMSPPFNASTPCAGQDGVPFFNMTLYQMRQGAPSSCLEKQTGRVYTNTGLLFIAGWSMTAGDSTRPAGDVFHSLYLTDFTSSPNVTVMQYGMAKGGAAGAFPL
jgi:hypothetical protein